MPTFDNVNKTRYAKLDPNYVGLEMEYEECSTTNRPIVKKSTNNLKSKKSS